MAEDYDLINELMDLCNKLSVAGKQLKKYGLIKAEKERDYKVCLHETALRLRETKDMPVTLIDKVVYGEKEVADKRFERDVAETLQRRCIRQQSRQSTF